MDKLYFILWGTLLLLLLIASTTDTKKGIIPNWLILVGIGMGACGHFVFQGRHGLILSVLGGLLWLIFTIFVWHRGWLGGGDVKLLCVIAVFTGAMGSLLILTIAVVGQFFIFLIRFARGHMELRLPFAPAITLGSLGLLLGQMLMR